MTTGLNICSEIGELRKVMLHRPGDELLNLSPDNIGRLLFDDIPFLETAQAEHDRFAQMLRDEGVEVLYLDQLVAEALAANPTAREPRSPRLRGRVRH
jgi:arginine deiminase